MDDADLGVWARLSPREAASLFEGMKAPWWIAGGHAIELFVGRPIREHGDLDVGVLRRDQLVVREHLNGWDLRAASGGTLRPWPAGKRLRDDVNDVWGRRDPEDPWALQLNLNDAEEDNWVFRRDRRVSRPLGEIVLRTREGLPYLAPEVQLLFKAKDPRPKDGRPWPIASTRARPWSPATWRAPHWFYRSCLRPFPCSSLRLRRRFPPLAGRAPVQSGQERRRPLRRGLEQVGRALALSRATESAALVLGPALGSAVLLAFGPAAGLVFDALTFAAGSVAAARVPRPPYLPGNGAPSPARGLDMLVGSRVCV